jgi:hypothetical protein
VRTGFRVSLVALWSLVALGVQAQPAPGLRLEVIGEPVTAIEGARPGCDATDVPDAPARAVRGADGEVQLYATDSRNRVERGPGLLQLHHRCPVVMAGAGNDNPAAYDDRAWIASPWTADGRTIWAVVHNEFHGHRRPALCPTGRYMDCWFNALTEAVSHDGGRSFQRVPGRAVVAALPYRYDQVGRGHHGYFNPSNVVTLDGGFAMFAFATHAGVQREGNCLLRTTEIGKPELWRGWNGSAFDVTFIDPYAETAAPEAHVCAPVALGQLRWPVTSLVRHQPSGLFIALMLNAARAGGVFYATSPDLRTWSSPALLMTAIGEGAWTCADPPPIAFPSLLDPASTSRSFETVGADPVLFATRFNIANCKTSLDRELVRWRVRIDVP